VIPQNPEVQFRLSSSLMLIKASPDPLSDHPHAYTYYFLWDQSHWRLLRRVALR
jgi:hypothetical protein